jgi:hypothetical protein
MGMAEMGPVQLIAVGFGPDAKFEGKILGELVALDQEKTIRVLDLLFVQKDAESGDLVAGDFQGEELGGIVGALLGFDFEGVENPPAAENGSGARGGIPDTGGRRRGCAGARSDGRGTRRHRRMEVEMGIGGGGLMAARAGNRMQMRQGYRTMARMQRRRSFV